MVCCDWNPFLSQNGTTKIVLFTLNNSAGVHFKLASKWGCKKANMRRVFDLTPNPSPKERVAWPEKFIALLSFCHRVKKGVYIIVAIPGFSWAVGPHQPETIYKNTNRHFLHLHKPFCSAFAFFFFYNYIEKVINSCFFQLRIFLLMLMGFFSQFVFHLLIC